MNSRRDRVKARLPSPCPSSPPAVLDDVGARPVVTGPVYVRSQGQWRLGTLTVARDSLRFTSSGAAPLGFVELLLGCADVARGRVLCSAEADHDPGVFEVEVLPSVRGATATAVRELSVRASRDGRGECVWFKVGDMARATEWAEAVDDASQAAGDAAAGLIWDWFRVPGPGAGPAVLAFNTGDPLPQIPSAGPRYPTAASGPAFRAGDPTSRDSGRCGGSAVSSASSHGDHEVGGERLPPLQTTLPLAMDLVRRYAAIARRRRRLVLAEGAAGVDR